MNRDLEDNTTGERATPRTTLPSPSHKSLESSLALHSQDKEIVRSDIWFEDGTVILQAEATQFRVHRGVLSLHSSFFKDMFTIPQPESDPTIDGCPVVHVSDSAQDWHTLLNVMYDSREMYKSTATFPIKFMIPMLRLGHKYDFENFRTDALERLKVQLPQTLEAWDALFDDPFADYTRDNEFDLINIALELSIQSVLPAAFYICLTHRPMEDILRGFERKDGTMAYLSHESQKVLVLGRDKLFDGILNYVLWWLKGSEGIPADDCQTKPVCKSARMAMLELYCLDLDASTALDPDTIDSICEEFCAKCATSAKVFFNDGREDVWGDLPTYFKLPDWENLTDF